MRVPRDGGVKKLAELLNYLNQRCIMVWIVPSSTNLVDISDFASKNMINREQFAELMQTVDIKHVNLNKIFRNTMNISNIVPAGQTKKYSSVDRDETTAIDGGQCSTIVGSRPTAVLLSGSDQYNYKLYSDIIVKYINNNIGGISVTATRIAILCDKLLEPKQLMTELFTKLGGIKYYDGGVKKFDGDGIPTYDDTNVCYTGDLESWILNGGLLLTHDILFNGAEADTVIFVSSNWGGMTTNIRSGVTRAVSHFCLVCNVAVTTNVEKFSQSFNVEDLRTDQDKVTTSRSSDSTQHSAVNGVSCDGCLMNNISGAR